MFNLNPVKVPDLSGKTILVTGAGRGIGSVLAGLLVSKGADVYAGFVSDPEPAWAANLEGATLVRLDVTRQQDIDHVMSRIRDEAGRLDALVNNAGTIAPIGHVESAPVEGLRQAVEVNFLGVHSATRAALAMLRESGGVVVNAGTGAATTPMEGWAAYCSSKAAARMLTQIYAMEMKGSGIRFHFLGIPPTDTAMQSEIRASGLNPISEIPREDLVAPEVPASVMAWLCGPEAEGLEESLIDVRDDFFGKMMKG